MNDNNQYMVQVGDYDQNTFIIQDANGIQYDGSAIISGDIAEGNNLISEPRWIQQNSARGGKIMTSQAFVNGGDLVSVNGTGLNLSTRFTPSSIVFNSATAGQFDQDSLRIASAVTGTGGRGRPRGRKPSRGNFPVVPIDMVRQLGIEQQVILQPTVPVATKNKAIQTSTIQMSKKTQCNDIGINDISLNSGTIEPNAKCIHVPVFIPVPVPVYIPIPTFVREKPKPKELEIIQEVKSDEIELIVEPETTSDDKNIVSVETVSIDNLIEKPTEEANTNSADALMSAGESPMKEVITSQPFVASSQDKHITISNDEESTPPKEPPVESKKRRHSDTESMPIKIRKTDASVIEKKEIDPCKLKYSYGINAWRHWSKNLDLLKLTVTEINKYMIEFVQKIRKPTNEPYVPDSIFYLCLGIQLFLLDHKNELNLFVDPRLLGFQSELNKILATFQPKLGENHVLVCRIEEDHLWESRQLGCHDPGVLLFTVCYILTRNMKISTVEEHAKLSVSQLEVTESKITYLSNTDNVRYELCAETNSKRCFYSIVRTYMEKRSVSMRIGSNIDFGFSNELGGEKSRMLYLRPLSQIVDNDTDRDSLWYESNPVDSSLLDMMLNRIRIVKEVQESLLSSSNC